MAAALQRMPTLSVTQTVKPQSKSTHRIDSPRRGSNIGRLEIWSFKGQIGSKKRKKNAYMDPSVTVNILDSSAI